MVCAVSPLSPRNRGWLRALRRDELLGESKTHNWGGRGHTSTPTYKHRDLNLCCYQELQSTCTREMGHFHTAQHLVLEMQKTATIPCA